MNDVAISFFLSLIRTKSFTATANQMLTTKQFVSKTVQAMEEELGFPLFIRDSRSVVPTAMGEQLAEFMRDCDKRYCTANSNNRLFSERRYIWVAVETWVGWSPVIMNALNEFERIHNCTIRIRETGDGKAMGLLMAGDVDVALTSNYCAKRLSSLCEISVLEERGMCLTIAANHPLATQLGTQALLTIPFLTVFAGEHSQNEVYDRVNQMLDMRGHTMPQIQIKQSLAEVLAEVLLGNGVTVLPTLIVSKEMIQVPLHKTVTMVLARMKSRRLPIVDELEAYIRRTVGGVGV